MNAHKSYDIAVIGGGIVGTATALKLLEREGLSLVLLESESQLGVHQTGHNSGVIHSGLYYRPGSLKANNCARGRQLLTEFCTEHQIPYDICGKIVVATNEREVPALEDLAQRGKENGLQGIKLLNSREIKEYEPHVEGMAGLFIPQTGVVNFKKVTEKFGEIIKKKGGVVRLDSRVKAVNRQEGEWILKTDKHSVHSKFLVNCAGLHSDRVAKLCGLKPGLRIIPFRGEYYSILPAQTHLVRHLIYPVPDPAFPFLGVHFTRMIDGMVEAGPNAVPALKRHGYKKTDMAIKDTLETFFYPGFLRLVLKHWRMGLGEIYRSLSKRAFLKALNRLVPELQGDYMEPAAGGVRAQALEPDGYLVDDFYILEEEGMIHVLNAPSPAATASLSIGEFMAKKTLHNFDL